jgi:hypothetical protein
MHQAKQQTMNPRKLCPSLRWLVERFAKINLVNFLLKIGRDRRLSSAVRRREDAAELSEYLFMLLPSALRDRRELDRCHRLDFATSSSGRGRSRQVFR